MTRPRHFYRLKLIKVKKFKTCDIHNAEKKAMISSVNGSDTELGKVSVDVEYRTNRSDRGLILCNHYHYLPQ